MFGVNELNFWKVLYHCINMLQRKSAWLHIQRLFLARLAVIIYHFLDFEIAPSILKVLNIVSELLH